jgi:hypothetical protein
MTHIHFFLHFTFSQHRVSCAQRGGGSSRIDLIDDDPIPKEALIGAGTSSRRDFARVSLKRFISTEGTPDSMMLWRFSLPQANWTGRKSRLSHCHSRILKISGFSAHREPITAL